ncbi:MAG: helix-turn-helix transcriptional regulator [Clostridia bacterium]|nr:helix-turn-helix transcriptional regulator [Clostridia bacterium]
MYGFIALLAIAAGLLAIWRMTMAAKSIYQMITGGGAKAVRNHTIRLRICQLRKAAGMTQGELAAQIGIKQSTLCQYEQSTHLPSLSRIVAIADALGCTVDELIWRPDMTSVRLDRIRETERRNEERIRAWEEAHEQA